MIGDDDDQCDGEPEEDDYVTEDHQRFFQYGKLALTVAEGKPWASALVAHMRHERFWPDVWWISDHGNAHLLDMCEALKKEDQ